MGWRRVNDWSPVARFSVALALVLVVTAVALGGLTAFLIGRYVEDETVNFTQDAVAGHFGTVFQTSVALQAIGCALEWQRRADSRTIALLDDTPIAHSNDSVGIGSRIGIMGDHQDRLPKASI